MIKKIGEKNPLTTEEKAYYKSQLGGAYIIGKQLGISGQGTSTYLLTDKKGNRYALKIPNDPQKIKSWLEQQERAEELRNQYIGEYRGAIHIPKTIQKGKDFIIEELAEGKEFLERVYDKLTPSQKRRVAKDFAEFLNYSHQRTLTGKTSKMHPDQQDRISWQDTYNYFSLVLTEAEKKELQKEIQIYTQQKETLEILAFRDYRSQNLLWDDKKGCLSIIDFDCTKKASVYEEFIPYAAASSCLSYQFLRDVIKAYNECPKEHPLFIDLETVRNNYFVGIYHEYARCNIGKNPPEKYLRMLRSDLKKLKKLMPTTLKKRLKNGSTPVKVEKEKTK